MPAKSLYKLLRKKVRDMDMNLVLWIWSTRTRTQTRVLVLVLTHFFSTRTRTHTHAKQSTRTRTQDLCTRPTLGSSILSTHIPFVPCQSAIPFLRYSIFKIWPWKSMVKVMGEVTVWSHNVGLTSYRLISLLFHVNRAPHSWIVTFSKFDLENQRSRSWAKSQFKVTMWV